MFVVRHAIGLFRIMAISVEEFKKLMEQTNEAAYPKKSKSHHDEPEYRLQCECVSWFYAMYPEHYIVASANGGKRDAITAAKLKHSGVKAGEPDLKIGVARHGYHHLYIELKNGKKGRTSEEQDTMIAYYRAQGCKVEVVRTFEEFAKIVTEYMD